MPIRRDTASLLALGSALAVLLAVSGCDPTDGPAGPDAAGTPPTSTGEPPSTTGAEQEQRAENRPKLQVSTVALDGVVLRVGARDAAAVRADESSPGLRTVTLSLPPGGSARLALASPGALDVDTDGSITVLDGDDKAVAAIGPPAAPSLEDADDAPRIEVTATDATHARVEVSDRTRAQVAGATAGTTPARPLEIRFTVGTHAVESATWGENEGGRSLAVDPTNWARHAGQAGLDLIRTQLVAAEPDAGTATMGDQLVCHALGAPDKATWNLEPWRPDIGLIRTAAAQCNPV